MAKYDWNRDRGNSKYASPVASLPEGPKTFLDAAFNPPIVADVAALGVFLQNPLHNVSVYIQAMSNSAKSALEAEAQAMLLAALLAHALSWKNVCFLSDCQVLVDAAEANDLVSKPGHWAIRPILAEFAATRNYHSQRVIKISREENKIADTLAKRAFRNRTDSTTSFS